VIHSPAGQPAAAAASREADLATLNAKADALMAQVQQAGVRVDCKRRDADVPAHVWAQLSTTEKRGFVITAARSCRVPRFTLRDAATARTMATLSAGQVTFD